jgi:hypothetical protein
MSLSQWKAYFSMFVLGQTDPIGNPTHYMSSWYRHQSCPWLGIVENFEHQTRYYWKEQYDKTIEEIQRTIYREDEYCRCCGEQSRDYYCRYCEAERCGGCGERGCGAYMCRACRRNEQCY